jgi:hypothetical protein
MFTLIKAVLNGAYRAIGSFFRGVSDVYKRDRLKRTAEHARQREGLRKELKAEILDDMKRRDSNS